MVTITKTDDSPMQEYLGKIQDINRKINKVGIEFPDNLLACFFLMGLPMDKYEGLLRNLEREDEKLNTKTVKAKLLLEEIGLLHTVILLKEMVTITKTDDLPMQEYLGKIQDINRKINKVGIEFPDNLLACFFLMGLLMDKYEGLVRN
ncbi:hypothetical protein QE152_g41483 [Popillia japonica]|uniref:Uncharacterized protein n=1 Tax=Popillia japonica TaxID=7064 RepID=A0AAW1GGM0_POPJA